MGVFHFTVAERDPDHSGHDIVVQNAGNFYIYSIRLENGKWVVYYSYYSLKVCVKTVPCCTMWCSAVAQGLREAMASTFLLLLCVCIHRGVWCVQDSYRDHFGDPSENFPSGIQVSLPLSVLAISLLCAWPSAPVVHNPTLSQLPQLPISHWKYSHSQVSDTWQPSIQCNLQYPVIQWMMVVSAFSLLCS